MNAHGANIRTGILHEIEQMSMLIDSFQVFQNSEPSVFLLILLAGQYRGLRPEHEALE